MLYLLFMMKKKFLVRCRYQSFASAADEFVFRTIYNGPASLAVCCAEKLRQPGEQRSPLSPQDTGTVPWAWAPQGGALRPPHRIARTYKLTFISGVFRIAEKFRAESESINYFYIVRIKESLLFLKYFSSSALVLRW